jgi:hypothetical protein
MMRRMPAWPTVATIQRQIVARLAERSGRDCEDLERELRLADSDLPVEAGELMPLLDTLERDFAVALSDGRVRAPDLDYVRDLAIFIQQRMIEQRMIARVA